MALGTKLRKDLALTFPFAFRRSEIKFWSPRACEDIVEASLVVQLFYQERFGGCLLLPKRAAHRNTVEHYEMIPRAILAKSWVFSRWEFPRVLN